MNPKKPTNSIMKYDRRKKESYDRYSLKSELQLLTFVFLMVLVVLLVEFTALHRQTFHPVSMAPKHIADTKNNYDACLFLRDRGAGVRGATMAEVSDLCAKLGVTLN